ncbi:MAG: LysM peptidoglycan-binding domain-containing protein [Anaerolineae bacterium]
MARKVCPICGTVSHPNATVCPTCGTSLSDVQPENDHRPRATRLPGYDRRYGETDLFEGEGRRSGEWLLTVVGIVVLAGLCVGALLLALPGVIGSGAASPTPEILSIGSPTVPGAILVTNTVQSPMPALATVTPAPPTQTLPPTEGPCTYVVQSGDDLISLAYACGYRSLDIVPTILEMNDLSAPEAIQVGQTIIIPRPSPTPDPNAAALAPTATASDGASDVAALFVAEANATPPTATFIPTPTLLPGLMWHTVQSQESMVAIMYQYNTTAEVLAQINPEIAFSQCDFKYDTGGPACTVLLQPGQLFRVPAPTPTPTLSPTPSGSETATPTATATYNAPNALSPADRTRFTADQIVTLRWVTTGQLGVDEKYRVTVVDDTAGASWTGDTTELTFIVPSEWQGTDGQPHVFRWSVGVTGGTFDALRYETPARTFIWNSQGTVP